MVNSAVKAVEVPGLYEAEVPVSGQGAAERLTASRTALEQVLVKVSGNADVAQLPQIEPLLKQAEQWVQRYQYRAAPPDAAGTAVNTTQKAANAPAEAAEQPNADTPATPGQLLWESFDRQTINQRLYDAGVPVWGVNRPATLLWLVISDGGDRYLVGGDNRPDVQAMVTAQARRRGLPLNVPLLDLQDQGALTVTDVWGDFPDVISRASERYQPDAILVGRVYSVAADQWQGHWTLYHRGDVTTWETDLGSQDTAIAAGIAGTTQQFAKRYALDLTPGIANTVSLSIENVATLSDYARLMRYLQSLDPVAEVRVARIEGPMVNLRVKVRGEPRGLIQTIALGKTLVAAAQPAGTSEFMTPAADGAASGLPAPEEYRYRIAQ